MTDAMVTNTRPGSQNGFVDYNVVRSHALQMVLARQDRIPHRFDVVDAEVGSQNERMHLVFGPFGFRLEFESAEEGTTALPSG